MMKKIYFAGSIRGQYPDIEIYKYIMNRLSKFGKVLTEHIVDTNVLLREESINNTEIFNRDIHWLTQADCIVAEVSAPSLGVGYELAISDTLHKPILCLCRKDINLSAIILGNANIITERYLHREELDIYISKFFSNLEI